VFGKNRVFLGYDLLVIKQRGGLAKAEPLALYHAAEATNFFPTLFRHQSCIVVLSPANWATGCVILPIKNNRLYSPIYLRTKRSGVRTEKREA